MYLNVPTGVDSSGKTIYSSGAGDAPAAYTPPAATTPAVPAPAKPVVPVPAPPAPTYAPGTAPGNGAVSTDANGNNYSGSAATAPPAGATPSSVYGADYSPSAVNAAEAASANFAQNGLDEASQDQVRADTLKSFQAEIDATNKIYADKLAAAKVTGANTLGSTTAVEARRGLLGSDFGNAQTDTTNAANDQIYSSIGDEQANAIATINTAGQKAVTDALAAKTTAKQQGLDAYLKYLSDAGTRATTSATTAATLLLNNKQDPTTLDSTTLQSLLQNYGISSDQLDSAYTTAKTAQDQAAAKAAKDNQTVLTPGSSIIGADGKVIASLPPKDTYTVVKGTKTTDAFGNESTSPDRVFDSTTGQFVGTTTNSGPASANLPGTGGGSANLPGGKTTAVASGSGLDYAQYGKLANTDFNPSSTEDQLAQKYLDSYIKNGTVPTYTSLGRSITPAGFAQITSRAGDLYYQATGAPLPTPQIIKAQQAILANNYKLGNNLGLQEQTVTANVDLSLANMTKNGLNGTGFKPLDQLIDTVKDTLQDPNVGQFLAQNTTIQNEVGSLLAVKNASGTTVYDKLSSAGIIGKNDSPAVVQQKLQTLIKEASNFSSALQNADSTSYKFTDPLEQDANNPARNSGIVNNLLSKQGIDYNDLISQMSADQANNPGKVPALDITTGQPYWVTQGDIATGKYVAL